MSSMRRAPTSSALRPRPIGMSACGMTSGMSAAWLRWSNSAASDHRPADHDQDDAHRDPGEVGEDVEPMPHRRGSAWSRTSMRICLPWKPTTLLPRRPSRRTGRASLPRPRRSREEHVAADDVAKLSATAISMETRRFTRTPTARVRMTFMSTRHRSPHGAKRNAGTACPRIR